MAIRTKKTRVNPGTEPLSLSDVKEWLRVSDDPAADDDLITALITETRVLIEESLNIAMVEYTIDIEASLRSELKLPFRPISTVTSVKDRDANDLTYEFDGFRISLNSLSDVVAVYTCGYPAIDLPEGLILGWKEVIAVYYENRGDRMNTDFDPRILIRQNPTLAAYDRNAWWL